MLTLSQYVLSKIAEEATELAKEALKGQQQGLFSTHRGKTNHEYIRDEYIDLIARSTILNWCSDIKDKQGDKFNLLVDRYTIDRATNELMQQSINKMCYWAYFSYKSGQLELTEEELNLIIYHYNQYLPTINRERAEGIDLHPECL